MGQGRSAYRHIHYYQQDPYQHVIDRPITPSIEDRAFERLIADMSRHNKHSHIFLTVTLGRDVARLIAKVFIDESFKIIYKEEKEK